LGKDPIYPHPIGYDKMASGVKLIEGKIGARMGINKRLRLVSTPRREETPRGRATGYGQPAVDIRYLERQEAGAGLAQERGEEEEGEDRPQGRPAGGREDVSSVNVVKSFFVFVFLLANIFSRLSSLFCMLCTSYHCRKKS
jgi:hypothetical protein